MADTVVEYLSRADLAAPDAGGAGQPAPREQAMRDAVTAARASLQLKSAELGCDLHELACTVLVVGAWGEDLLVAHLGDGALVGRDEEGILRILSAPDRGEYANETWFLTGANWEAHLRVTAHTRVDAFGAFTDGCQAASLVAGSVVTPFMPFWEPVFDFARDAQERAAADEEIANLLNAEHLRASSKDDKTLVMGSRRQASVEPPMR